MWSRVLCKQRDPLPVCDHVLCANRETHYRCVITCSVQTERPTTGVWSRVLCKQRDPVPVCDHVLCANRETQYRCVIHCCTVGNGENEILLRGAILNWPFSWRPHCEGTLEARAQRWLTVLGATLVAGAGVFAEVSGLAVRWCTQLTCRATNLAPHTKNILLCPKAYIHIYIFRLSSFKITLSHHIPHYSRQHHIFDFLYIYFNSKSNCCEHTNIRM